MYSRELGRWPCWRASALWLGDRTGVLLFLHPSCILLSSQKLDLLGWPSQVVWAVMGGHRFHSVSVKRSSFLLQPSHSSSLPRSLDYRREPILPAKRANSTGKESQFFRGYLAHLWLKMLPIPELGPQIWFIQCPICIAPGACLYSTYILILYNVHILYDVYVLVELLTCRKAAAQCCSTLHQCSRGRGS